ncbi:unnamed protein product [Closterium sp. NIES-64]|nr:unnamed protein product [Closterium sp. NIES-64]
MHVKPRVEIARAGMPQSPAGAPAVVSLAPSNADAAPSTPLQHTATHGVPLGVSVEVEVVDERLRKGSEKVDNHQQVTEVGQDKEEEKEKMAQGDPMELTSLGRSEGGAEDYGVDVRCERDVLSEHSGSQTGADEGIASDGDGTEGEGKRGTVCEVADGLGKVYGEDKPYRAGGFFKRKKATAGSKYCSEQTVGGCKRNLGNFDSERNRNLSIAIYWMAYTPDADPITYDMDKEDVQARSAHLNLAKQLPTGVWSVLNELHISRIEK